MPPPVRCLRRFFIQPLFILYYFSLLIATKDAPVELRHAVFFSQAIMGSAIYGASRRYMKERAMFARREHAMHPPRMRDDEPASAAQRYCYAADFATAAVTPVATIFRCHIAFSGCRVCVSLYFHAASAAAARSLRYFRHIFDAMSPRLIISPFLRRYATPDHHKMFFGLKPPFR